MTENELMHFWGKNVKVTFTDGDVLTGHAAYFADSYDNDPDEASITLEDAQPLQREVVISLSEIKAIEVIK